MAQFKVKIYYSTYTVDEANSESRIRAKCPNFFNFPGRNKRYSFYRGCVIASSIVQYTGTKPQRKYVAYIYDDAQADTFCVSPDCEPKNLRAAKRLIDRVLMAGRYEYGDNKPVV